MGQTVAQQLRIQVLALHKVHQDARGQLRVVRRQPDGSVVGVMVGQVVINPSGGLLSKGHPLGATGLAQCFELTQQLRGKAQARQVPGARLGLQHNLGLGGAAVVTLYGQV